MTDSGAIATIGRLAEELATEIDLHAGELHAGFGRSVAALAEGRELLCAAGAPIPPAVDHVIDRYEREAA